MNKEMSAKDSDDGEIDKLLAELENEPEESTIIVEKQIQKNIDENKSKKQTNDYDVGDKEIKDDDDESGEDYWS